VLFRSGVESAFAATQAAGGAPPDMGDRVLRFGTAGLRHRGRALTAQDFEDLALESSIDIAQARCFVSPGGVRMVIVMRGAEPRPGAAAKRELYRALVSAGPVALGKPQAMTVAGPRLRRLRVDLALQIPSLDDAGQVADDGKQALESLFDPATGGCADRYRSVTTISGSATAADALSTAFSLMSEPQIRSVLPRVDIERVHLIDAAGAAFDIVA